MHFATDDKRKVKFLFASGNRATKVFLISLFILIFLLILVVFVYGRNSFDRSVFDFLALHITPSRVRFMNAISILGNQVFLIPANIALLIYFVIRRNSYVVVRVAMVATTSVLVMEWIKNIFHRVRPENPLISVHPNFSFPSGHSFMSVAFYGLLIWLTAIYIPNKKLQQLLIMLFLFLILLIGFTRVYLRVHYATDVIAGLCIGSAWLILSFSIIDKIESRLLTRETN